MMKDVMSGTYKRGRHSREWLNDGVESREWLIDKVEWCSLPFMKGKAFIDGMQRFGQLEMDIMNDFPFLQERISISWNERFEQL